MKTFTFMFRMNKKMPHNNWALGGTVKDEDGIFRQIAKPRSINLQPGLNISSVKI